MKLIFVSKAHLPTQFGDFEIHGFTDTENREHIAITKGLTNSTDHTHSTKGLTNSTNHAHSTKGLTNSTDHTHTTKGLNHSKDPELTTKTKFPPTTPPLVRIHSECFTGDILGSLKCDCGDQLQTALKLIEQAKLGIVIYLRQEGRGIGLLNKIKAYKLQEQGLDTLEANLHLGLPADARNYDIASEILKYFGITQIKLLTNNPDKIAQLENQGIKIIERIDISTKQNGHNKKYIETKNEKFGHLFK